MTNLIKLIFLHFLLLGFISCSNTPNEGVRDTGLDVDSDNGGDGDISPTCFGPGADFQECGERDPNCIFTNGTKLLVDKADSCSDGQKEGYCVLYGEPTANSSSNVFYREKDGDYEYLRISPYVPFLTGSNWISCEADLSTSPAPGCKSCEDDRP